MCIRDRSTAWPMVTRPAWVGGLGFGMKWDMGWMHDTLEYMKLDPIHRKYHHDKLTFRMLYAYSENYVLPLSHDEDVGRPLAEAREPAAALRLDVVAAREEAPLHGGRDRTVARVEP